MTDTSKFERCKWSPMALYHAHMHEIFVLDGIFLPRPSIKIPSTFLLASNAVPERQLLGNLPALNIFRVFWLMEKSFLFLSSSAG